MRTASERDGFFCNAAQAYWPEIVWTVPPSDATDVGPFLKVQPISVSQERMLLRIVQSRFGA